MNKTYTVYVSLCYSPLVQESRKSQSNRTRAQATQRALIDVARLHFASSGFAATKTPEIVAQAGVTRGALYHHFDDKLGLFRAVLEEEAKAVSREIEQGADKAETPLTAILNGADAYFDAMLKPGRARLLLLEGPAALGVLAMDEIDRRTGRDELRRGLKAAWSGDDELKDTSLEALSAVLSAAFDKAALDIASGASANPYRKALRALLLGFLQFRE